MFPTTHRSPLAQRALGALRVARSFLLLEDDYDVDWEVDQDEPPRAQHPHRAPLRGVRAARRPGVPAPTCHVCLSPLERVGALRCARERRGQATGGQASARVMPPPSAPAPDGRAD